MGKISSYPLDATPSLDDKVIGTNGDDLDQTVNFKMSAIVNLVTATGLGVVLNGIGPPASSLGETGQLYWDTSTWDIYGPKSGSDWGDGTPLIDNSNPNGLDTYLVSGGVVWRGSGMIFEVSELVYYFDGVLNTLPDTEVTLSDGDATFDRIDAIIIQNDVADSVVVLEGTPSASPVSPTIEDDQLLVAYVNVLAGATTPDVNIDVIWTDDLISDATVTTTGGGTVVSDSTDNPESGSFCIGFTDTDTARNKFIYLDLSSPQATVDGDILTFYIRKDATSLVNSTSIRLRLYLSGVQQGITVIVNGFNQTLAGWQLMVIPINLFGPVTSFDRIRYHVRANVNVAPYETIDLSLDEVLLQSGMIPDTSSIRWEDIQGLPEDSPSLVAYIASVAGVGDVVGPASATDNAVARFDLATGKLIQDSVVLISDAGAVTGVTTLTVTDDAYGVGWDSSLQVPTKNAIYDKIESMQEMSLGIACGDETSDIAVATGVLTFQMPNYATTLTGISFNLKTAPTGSVATFDLNEGGASVLSTKVTIDAGETTSETAATPPVISDSAIAANAKMTVDIDGVGSTIAGVGLKMWLYYTKT